MRSKISLYILFLVLLFAGCSSENKDVKAASSLSENVAIKIAPPIPKGTRFGDKKVYIKDLNRNTAMNYLFSGLEVVPTRLPPTSHASDDTLRLGHTFINQSSMDTIWTWSPSSIEQIKNEYIGAAGFDSLELKEIVALNTKKKLRYLLSNFIRNDTVALVVYSLDIDRTGMPNGLQRQIPYGAATFFKSSKGWYLYKNDTKFFARASIGGWKIAGVEAVSRSDGNFAFVVISKRMAFNREEPSMKRFYTFFSPELLSSYGHNDDVVELWGTPMADIALLKQKTFSYSIWSPIKVYEYAKTKISKNINCLIPKFQLDGLGNVIGIKFYDCDKSVVIYPSSGWGKVNRIDDTSDY